MLNRTRVAEFRKRLLDLQRELQTVRASGEDAAGTVELDQTSVGRLSRMDAMQGQAMSKETNRRRGIELQRIVSALARMEAGDYGYCVACGEEIAEGRLRHNPAVPTCVTCAARLEASGR